MESRQHEIHYYEYELYFGYEDLHGQARVTFTGLRYSMK